MPISSQPAVYQSMCFLARFLVHLVPTLILVPSGGLVVWKFFVGFRAAKEVVNNETWQIFGIVLSSLNSPFTLPETNIAHENPHLSS